jgi:hypothetical protein
MIVLPPASAQEHMFFHLAKTTWESILKKSLQSNELLQKETQTLVAEVNVMYENNEYHICKFHYRYSKGNLYCFIEETER